MQSYVNTEAAKREKHMLENLSHPNIIQCIASIGDLEGKFANVFQIGERGSLAQVIPYAPPTDENV